jgi:hypothetical protein
MKSIAMTDETGADGREASTVGMVSSIDSELVA